MLKELGRVTRFVFSWLPFDIPFCFHLVNFPTPLPDTRILRLGRSVFLALSRLARDLALVVEDKDFNTLWIAHPIALISRWLAQLHASSGSNLTNTPHAQVLAWYRLLHDHVMVRKLRDAHSPISLHSLPYIYPTIKRKCWRDSVPLPVVNMRTCTKSGHACMRNICSFARLLSKRAWRVYARAYTFIGHTFYRGWGFDNLNVAPTQLASDMKAMFASKHHETRVRDKCCQICKSSLLHPTVVVVDAAQAFEALSAEIITEAHARLWEHVDANKHCSSIPVLKQCKSASFGGDPRGSLRDRDIVLSRTLKKVAAFMAMNLFRLGPYMIHQQNGIPIGGNLSSAILDNALSFLETSYDKGHPGRTRHCVVRRYVDDLIVCSFTRCRSCVFSFLARVYQGYIHFDSDNSQIVKGACVIQPYLDLTLYLDWLSLDFALFPKYFNYACHRTLFRAL